jgi:hypothetical protein
MFRFVKDTSHRRSPRAPPESFSPIQSRLVGFYFGITNKQTDGQTLFAYIYRCIYNYLFHHTDKAKYMTSSSTTSKRRYIYMRPGWAADCQTYQGCQMRIGQHLLRTYGTPRKCISFRSDAAFVNFDQTNIMREIVPWSFTAAFKAALYLLSSTVSIVYISRHAVHTIVDKQEPNSSVTSCEGAKERQRHDWLN